MEGYGYRDAVQTLGAFSNKEEAVRNAKIVFGKPDNCEDLVDGKLKRRALTIKRAQKSNHSHYI